MRPKELIDTLDRLRTYWESKGKEFSEADLAPQFEQYFSTGGDPSSTRIEVRTVYDDGEVWVRRGTVSISQGWRPVFLLMSQANSHGSSDVLKHTDEITAVLPYLRKT